jgi:hypothetical protein
MHTFRRISLFGPWFAMILVFTGILAAPPVAALTIENPKIMADVMPGQTYRFPVALSLSPSDPATDLAIEVFGFGQSATGSYTLLAAEDDTGPFSARSFIAVDAPLVHINPGERKPFNVTVTIPENVGEGGRYALISIHPAPGGRQAAMSIAMIVPVLLTVKGSNLTHTGSITNLQVGEVMTGRPVEIKTTLRNTGNHHYYGALVNITITDSGGTVVATGSATTIFALLPGKEITLTVPITAPVNPGTYMVTSETKIAEGMVLLDTKTVPLTIQKSSQPPAGAAAPPAKFPWPDALASVGVISSAIILWSLKNRR